MTSDPTSTRRRLKFTLVVRDEGDDSSILDIVQRAVEDGLRIPAVGSTAPSNLPAKPDPEPRHIPVGGQIETPAREAIEKALAEVMEQFQSAGKEPSFDPAGWAAQLSKVWAVIRKAKTAGVGITVTPNDPLPPAEGS